MFLKCKKAKQALMLFCFGLCPQVEAERAVIELEKEKQQEKEREQEAQRQQEKADAVQAGGSASNQQVCRSPSHVWCKPWFCFQTNHRKALANCEVWDKFSLWELMKNLSFACIQAFGVRSALQVTIRLWDFMQASF